MMKLCNKLLLYVNGQLLSDNSHMPARVAIFTGKTKSIKMYSVKEFGYKCLLYSLYDILGYGEMLNIPQVDETNRVMERKEVNLFDIDVYGKSSIAIEDNTITVTIPFTRLNQVGDKVGDKEGNKEGNKILNSTQVKVLAEIRNNPNITKNQLIFNVGVGKTAIDRSLLKLKELGYIERIGSRKTGYWHVKID